jgi:hypothetical protein
LPAAEDDCSEVLDDPLQQARIAQQLHSLGPLLVAESEGLLLGRKRLLDLLILHLFQFQEHPAQVAADDFFLDAKLLCGLFDEHAALPRRVKIQCVHVEGLLAAWRRAQDKHIDLQQFVTQVFIKAADAVTAAAPVPR